MRLRWFLALTSVLIAVIGITVAINDHLDSGSGGSSTTTGNTAPPTTTHGQGTLNDNRPGNIGVSGTITQVHLEGAVLDPRDVKTPLTISSDRGFGNGGELTGITVGGKPSSAVWDGGRPFVLSSGPGLVLDPVEVDLLNGVIACKVGTTSDTLEPGDYQLDTPVAIGDAGIATPRESLAFTAGPKSFFNGHGDAALQLPTDAPATFTGPGLVHLVGTLVVQTEQGDQQASSLDLDRGAYELTFAPTAHGSWTVSGRVQSTIIGDLVLGG